MQGRMHVLLLSTLAGTPLEILLIARHLLDTKSPAEIEVIKERLQSVAEVPLDPILRLKAKMPCGLLETGRCSVYEQRPSICRVTLSQSRAACDLCLQEGRVHSIHRSPLENCRGYANGN